MAWSARVRWGLVTVEVVVKTRRRASRTQTLAWAAPARAAAADAQHGRQPAVPSPTPALWDTSAGLDPLAVTEGQPEREERCQRLRRLAAVTSAPCAARTSWLTGQHGGTQRRCEPCWSTAVAGEQWGALTLRSLEASRCRGDCVDQRQTIVAGRVRRATTTGDLPARAIRVRGHHLTMPETVQHHRVEMQVPLAQLRGQPWERTQRQKMMFGVERGGRLRPVVAHLQEGCCPPVCAARQHHAVLSWSQQVKTLTKLM
mmetsp:Transcript_12210/g.38719  ORF Transcript_12210/g.38719 Transcript_12210/m.38719 type:complete len:258 (+) Transcript_12210:902-1675(+)